MNSEKKIVLVVGGAGYIGSHVVKALRDAGESPVVFDNMSSGLQENLFRGIPFINGDTLFPEQLASAMKGVDSIIHMAALKAAGESMTEPEKYAENNISGTINLLNAATAAKVKYFVFSSSAAVYGEPQYLPLDESHPTVPMNFYGHTKLAIENLLHWYSQLKGLRFSSLRYFNAAGYDVDGELNGLEHKPNNLLPIVLETIVGRRDKIEVFGTDYDTRDGSCIRDYIHVSDLADAHLKALDYLKHENQDLVINLGTSKGLSVLEIIQIAREVSGQEFNYTLGPRRAGDPAVVLAKAELAAELLGWKPKHSHANTLLETTLRAYRQSS
ncbi:UDP-glucose 4-epimerase GalE [Deltaproteobacteria bacterium]|nr:UDP-glucose 4-epimerase GalE [Deltaproteobacteria bacterium]